MTHPAPLSIPYSHRVPLVACPFCRDLFDKEEAVQCPTCGIALAAVAKLPPSPTLRPETDPWEEDLGPEHDPLPWTYLGRGRGAAMLLSVIGVTLFLLPWIHMTLPYVAELSGWDLAHRMGWSWAAFAAWVVLAPIVASRRSIAQLRGARVAAAFLAAIPAITATILLVFPPQSSLIPVRLHFGWPIYATVAISLAAVATGVKLGGKVDVLVAKRGSSNGETLH
jgi:hypothetical protein